MSKLFLFFVVNTWCIKEYIMSVMLMSFRISFAVSDEYTFSVLKIPFETIGLSWWNSVFTEFRDETSSVDLIIFFQMGSTKLLVT